MSVKAQLKAVQTRARERLCKICFCHVPKCAGTSVSSAIDKQTFSLYERLLIPNFGIDLEATGRASRITSRSMRDLREELLSYALSLQNYKYASGHFPCRPNLVMEFQGVWNFVTILRNPIERWISEYIYNTYKAQSWEKNTTPIEDYIETEKGRMTGISYLLYFSNLPTDFAGNRQPYIDEAIENLSRFSVVGVSEDIGNFERQFETVFGKKLGIRQTNVSPKSNLKQRIKEDEALMAKISKLCEADQRVYQRIVEEVYASQP